MREKLNGLKFITDQDTVTLEVKADSVTTALEIAALITLFTQVLTAENPTEAVDQLKEAVKIL